MLGAFVSWWWPLLLAHVGVTGVSVGLGFLAEAKVRSRQIQADPLPPGQYRRELLANVRFCVVVPAALAAALAAEIVPWGADTLVRGVVSFFACNLLFEAYFYCLHRGLHARRLIRFHRFHHLSRVTTPLSGQSMSTVEALGWALGYVAVPWLLGQVAPVSMVGYLVYLGASLSANIVGHSNVELAPPSMARSPSVWLSHPYTFHALHHARYVKHFGFGATFMDRLLGTEWPDWVQRYAQVRAGRPLRERGKRAPER